MIILLKIIIAILCAIINHCSCEFLHKKLQYWYNANNLALYEYFCVLLYACVVCVVKQLLV